MMGSKEERSREFGGTGGKEKKDIQAEGENKENEGEGARA